MVKEVYGERGTMESFGQDTSMIKRGGVLQYIKAKLLSVSTGSEFCKYVCGISVWNDHLLLMKTSYFKYLK